MPLKTHFELMAGYNRWMNAKTYDAASKLQESDLYADKGAFFGSVFGTLNHIMVADTIWLKRFAEHPAAFKSLEGVRALPHPYSLSKPLHDDFASLRTAREAMDETIVRFAGEATEDDYAHVLHYANLSGQAHAKRFGELMQHFYNHQTHHRGQVTTLLTQSGVDVGVTDLAALIADV